MPTLSATGTKHRFLPIVLILAVFLSLTIPPVEASTFRYENTVHISNLHRIDDDFYAAGEKIHIDGTIGGDFCAAGYRIDLRGVVEGSANVAALYVDNSGRVLGSMRCGALQQLMFNGSVGGSLVAYAGELTLGQAALVEKDLHAVGTNVSLSGIVKGNVDVTARSVWLSSIVDGDVKITAPKITLAPPAVIRGNLTYVSDKQDALEQLAGVTVVGTVTWKLPEEAPKTESSTLSDIATQISSLLAAFLFGIIMVRLFRPYAEESLNQLRTRFSMALAAGLLGILILGFCVVVLLASLGSMAAGSVLMGKGQAAAGSIILIISTLMVPITSFASVSGGIILYSGWIVVGYLVGYLLLKYVWPQSKLLGVWGLLLGLVLLKAVFAVPYLGFILTVVVTLAGAGAVLLGVKNCRRENTATSKSADTPGAPEPPAQSQ
jgi:cytoskeletal protein CcmA (bactofilin family)